MSPVAPVSFPSSGFDVVGQDFDQSVSTGGEIIKSKVTSAATAATAATTTATTGGSGGQCRDQSDGPGVDGR